MAAPKLLSRWLPLTLLALVAFWLRTHDLARRPMHADEANQAVKTGELLETGHYAFDPREHHGPTLYYAALPIAWLRGERTLATLSETTVRLVPALFGTAAVILLALLATVGAPTQADAFQPAEKPRLIQNQWPAFIAATLLAVSPPAVYYSRFFIQETLLVTFTLATFVCGQRWWRSGKLSWALWAGTSIGLMQATKASAPFLLLAALLALPAARVRNPAAAHPARATLLAGLAALATAALFYSSFGTNPAGIADAFATYAHAFDRAGLDTGHEKPWWYYVHLFTWEREGGLFWHQLGFLILAVGGIITALASGDRLLRWAAVYTIALAVMFSLPAYKTPWHVIHWVPGLSLLAGGALAALARRRLGNFIASVVALVVVLLLGQQTRRAVFERPSDARNPYAYVHSAPDVLKLQPLAKSALARAPGQPIRVIGEEYWPLPWYLRGLGNVGYWTTAPIDCDGALVIASPNQAAEVRTRLRGTYTESILGLRPGVLLVVFTPER